MKPVHRLFKTGFGLCLVLWILITSCTWMRPELAGGSSPTLTRVPTQWLTPTPSPYPCPQATQEQPPQVEPVISPTNETSQVIHIHGGFDEATVETQSGVFSSLAVDGKLDVRIDLLPNTIHQLKVTVKVSQTYNGGCPYGGYTMTVVADTQGRPLEIVQGQPAAPSPVTEPLSPASIPRLKMLHVIALTSEQRAESAIFNASDQLVSFGMGQGVRFWNPPAGQFDHELLVNQAWMTLSAAFSPDGNWLANGGAGYDPSDDSQTYVRVWDLATGQARLFGHHPHQVKSLAFSPDSTLLASGGDDNTLLLWDVASGKQLAALEAHTTNNDDISLRLGITQLAWVDQNSLLVHANGAVLLWKMPSGEPVLNLDDRYQWMDFNPKTSLLALLRNGCVTLTRLPANQQQPLADDPANCQGYQRVDINPDGSLLAAQSEKALAIWDTRTGQRAFQGPNPLKSLFLFSPDWKYLARVNWDDQTLSLWGVQP
jgi:hypothetical protein